MTAILSLLLVYFMLMFFKSPVVLIFGFFLIVFLDMAISNYGCKYKVIENKLYLAFLGKNVYTFPLEKVEKIEVKTVFSIPFFARTISFGAGLMSVILSVKNGFIYILPLANYNSIKHDVELNT